MSVRRVREIVVVTAKKEKGGGVREEIGCWAHREISLLSLPPPA
jgi:hypothetical protein